MTAILCKWLNDEVRLEPKLGEHERTFFQPLCDDAFPAAEDSAFAEKFSSGYLFGQILYKYDLQADFCLFSKGTYVCPHPLVLRTL